jgi:hypothetical protein
LETSASGIDWTWIGGNFYFSGVRFLELIVCFRVEEVEVYNRVILESFNMMLHPNESEECINFWNVLLYVKKIELLFFC